MSTDKRALDDLDALFRGLPPAKKPSKSLSSSSARPNKKQKYEKKQDVTSTLASKENAKGTTSSRKRSARAARLASDLAEPKVESVANPEIERTYTPLLPVLLPPIMRAGKATLGGAASASASRLKEFIRGLLQPRGERAAASLIESRVHHKVINLENVSTQQAARSAEARIARAAGRVRQGLSRKQCNKKGLGALSPRDDGAPSFRDLLGVHDLWRAYASRLVSDCTKNPKAIEQRILSADLQGSYLTVSRASASSMVGVSGILLRETLNTFQGNEVCHPHGIGACSRIGLDLTAAATFRRPFQQILTPLGKNLTIPKRGCEVRLAFGGRVVTLAGRALEGRRVGRKKLASSSEKDTHPLYTAAL